MAAVSDTQVAHQSLVIPHSFNRMRPPSHAQVSLAWILAHLYSQPELLRRARAELAACSAEPSYAELSSLPFLNACIDESVRLHTMLPGNTVLRKAARDVRFGEVTIPRGSVLWLYPNAVHQDGAYFAEPASFCPMRFLRGDALRKQSEARRRPPPPSAALRRPPLPPSPPLFRCRRSSWSPLATARSAASARRWHEP